MKIRPSIRAQKMLEIQPSTRLVKKIMGGILNLTKKYFGAEILLNIPDSLLNMPPNFIEIANRFSNSDAQGFIVKSIKFPKPPDEPFIHRFITQINGKGLSTGADLLSEEKSLWKSLAESIERYLWLYSDDFFKKDIYFSSYRQIKEKALNIFDLAGFTEEQKKEFIELRFDENTKFGWTKTKSLITEKEIYCPVQLLSNGYSQEKIKKTEGLKRSEPMLRWSVTTGLATGRSLEEAIVKGVLEIIERDAFMISYLNKISPPIIDLEDLASQDQDMMMVLKMMRRYDLNLYLVRLPTDFSVDVVLAILYDDTGIGPALTVGASADFDTKTCILDSIAECLSVRQYLRETSNSSSDEKYELDLKSFDMDKKGRLLYWSKKENKAKLDFLIEGKTVNIDLLEKRRLLPNKESGLKQYYTKKLKFLKFAIKKKGYEAIYAELTTPVIKARGLRCVQVVIPQLQPLHLIEKIPYFGGKRLSEIPLKLGYNPAEELNKEPHPFP